MCTRDDDIPLTRLRRLSPRNANELSSASDRIKQVCSDRETPAALCQQRVYTGEQEETHSSSAASAWTPALFWWVRAVTWRRGVQMLCTLWLHLTVTAWKQLWTAQLITTQTCVMCVYRAKRFHWASFGGTLETDQSKPPIGVIVSKCVFVFPALPGTDGDSVQQPGLSSKLQPCSAQSQAALHSCVRPPKFFSRALETTVSWLT